MSAYMTKIRAVTLLDGDWNVEPWVVCQAFARWQRVCGKKVWTCFFWLGLDQILPNLEQRIYTDPAPTKGKLKEQLIV